MYDAKCYDLACAFLDDEHPVVNTPENRDKLAYEIQMSIESEIEDMRRATEKG